MRKNGLNVEHFRNITINYDKCALINQMYKKEM